MTSIVDTEEGQSAPSAEEIKEELIQKDEVTGEKAKITDDPKMNKKYTFDFSYTDIRGKVWRGKFTNKILTNNEIIQVSVTRSRLCAGVAVESLDQFTYEHSNRLAHLTWSLIGRPKWASSLGELYDPILLSRLHEEVMAHEATFHGRPEDYETGTSGTEDNKR